MVHESQFHDQNSFITLTYEDDKLPQDEGLDKTHFPSFIKRLRRKLSKKIKYYHCGEYGDQFGRPHYHACIFGWDFPDKEHLFTSNDGHEVFTSEQLRKAWGHGHVSVAALTFESAAYVARYTVKKITGDQADEHYIKVNPITGEAHHVEPEYATMSKGIGKRFLEQYHTDVYPNEIMVINRGGRHIEVRPPKYYDKLFEKIDPQVYQDLMTNRQQEARKKANNRGENDLVINALSAELNLKQRGQLK